MLHVLLDTLWGAAYLLVFGLAPYALPAASLSTAAAGPGRWLPAVAALLVLGAAVAGVVALWRRRARVPAALLAAAAASAVACSASLRGDDGPTLWGVWYVAPFSWLALAGFVASRLPAIRRGVGLRPPIAVVGLTIVACVAGAASFAIARHRVGSREAMWHAVLARAPASQADAVAFARRLDAQSRKDEARSVLAACVAYDAAACECQLRLAGREDAARLVLRS